MKVRLSDGSYLVAVGIGGQVHAKNLKRAEEIEKSAVSEWKWALFLSAIIVVIFLIV